MVADANYGLPLASLITTGKRNDSPELPSVMDHAATLNPWLRPAVAIADKGYDSMANHEHLIAKGAAPVIHLRKLPNDRFYDGIYTERGVPHLPGHGPDGVHQERSHSRPPVPLPGLSPGQVEARRGKTLRRRDLGRPTEQRPALRADPA